MTRCAAVLLFVLALTGSAGLHLWLFGVPRAPSTPVRPDEESPQAPGREEPDDVVLVESPAEAAAAEPSAAAASPPEPSPPARRAPSPPPALPAGEATAAEGAGAREARETAPGDAPILELDVADVDAVRALVRTEQVPLCLFDVVRGQVVTLSLTDHDTLALGEPIPDTQVSLQPLPTHDEAGGRLTYAAWLRAVQRTLPPERRPDVRLGLRRDHRLDELMRAALADACRARSVDSGDVGRATLRVTLRGGRVAFEVDELALTGDRGDGSPISR